MKRKSAVLTAPRKFEVIEEELAPLQPHEVLIEVESVGLCHSDTAAYNGDGSIGFDHRGHMSMVEVQYPMPIGHEAVGIVKEVGSAVTNFKVGDYVGATPATPGYTSHLVVPEPLCIYLPKDKIKREDLKYCLIEPSMCVANIVQAANPKLGEVIAVVGCGMMGALTIAGLKHSSASKIIAIDVDETRLALAKNMGATHTINPSTCGDLTDAVDALTDAKGADTVIEITGNLKGLKTAIKTVKYGDLLGPAGRGKILIPSLYAKKEEWDPEIGFELAYRSPILHSVHPPYAEDYMKVCNQTVDAIVNGVLPIKSLITHEFSLEDTQKGFEVMTSRNPEYIKGIVTPKL